MRFCFVSCFEMYGDCEEHADAFDVEQEEEEEEARRGFIYIRGFFFLKKRES